MDGPKIEPVVISDLMRSCPSWQKLSLARNSWRISTAARRWGMSEVRVFFATSSAIWYDIYHSKTSQWMYQFIHLQCKFQNRLVCIKYPHYRIPWFHEKYCLENSLKSSISGRIKVDSEVRSDVLGWNAVVWTWVKLLLNIFVFVIKGILSVTFALYCLLH